MTKSLLLFATVFAVASCAAPQKSSRISVAIAGLGAKDQGESVDLAMVAEERLMEAFSESPPFMLLERKRLADVLKEQGGGQVGRLAGAEWLIYGVLEAWGVRLMDDGSHRAEVEVRLTVVRVVDGRIILSRAEESSALGPSETDSMVLLRRATREAVDKLFAVIVRLDR